MYRVLRGDFLALSTVGILGQIVTVVGAGEGRSGVGTLASPMGGCSFHKLPTLESTPGDAPLTTRKESRDGC